MLLAQLNIHNLRAIEEAQLDFSPGINLIYGKNGSGKTSVFEALALLSRGKSFVSSNNRDLIAFDKGELSCSLSFFQKNNHRAGFSVNINGEKRRKLDGEQLKSAQKLAKKLPLLFVTPTSFNLLDGGAKERRQFIDWLVFHVEPDFAAVYSKLRRLVKQRNALLKQRGVDLSFWDDQLIQISEQANQMRERTFSCFVPFFEAGVREWLGEKEVSTKTYLGWSANASLEEQLKKDLQQDQKRGFTSKGAHRYDLLFFSSGHKAAQVFSRGEKKRLVLALVFSQLQLALQQGLSPTLLIDDLGSELDEGGCKKTLEEGARLCEQMLVTNITKTDLEPAASRVFHVEQGKVKQQISATCE